MVINRRNFLASIPPLATGAVGMLNPPRSPAAQESGQDRSIEKEVLNFTAQDGVATFGIYHRPAGKNPKTAVIIAHPRANWTQHWLSGPLTSAGYGALCCATRWLNNDINAVQEASLLDIAAWIQFLKENYNVERIVSFGHSGGASLFAFYQGQAILNPPERLSSTPAGDPPDLNQFTLPLLDGSIASAPHKGEGRILLARLDPAVVDEDNPLASDWTLDMYDPRNGYKKPPESSKYSPDFLARYSAAQEERVRRLDAKAYAIIDRQRRAHQQMQSTEFERLESLEQMVIRRTALQAEYMIIYRTNAMPVGVDLSIDPSDRTVGHLFGDDPEESNYTSPGTAQVLMPRAYLSTWSGLSSKMLTDENLARVTIPTLVMGGTADHHETPGIVRSSYEASGAEDKTLAFVKGGDHFYNPVEPAAAGKDTRTEAARIVTEWLSSRFSL